MPLPFQRARKPAEKEVRRQAILRAARGLTSEVGSSAFSLNELARRARVSKPNIYRYFESREAVLLEVWVEEVRELIDRLERAFARLSEDDPTACSAAIARAFVAQPAMCELTSSCASLERNVSTATIVENKRALVELVTRCGQLLHERLPSISIEDCVWAASTTAIYVTGLWSAAHPTPTIEAAYAEPELVSLRPHFARDLTRFLEVLFAGLSRPKASARRR